MFPKKALREGAPEAGGVVAAGLDQNLALERKGCSNDALTVALLVNTVNKCGEIQFLVEFILTYHKM